LCYEPDINPTHQYLAQHCDVAVLPGCPMLHHLTNEKLNRLKPFDMARAFAEQFMLYLVLEVS